MTFLRDHDIRALNAEYLDHDWPTDVLSFALHAAGEPPLGDVYIGIDRAHEQAQTRDLSPMEEIVRLTIHGTLHVLGDVHPDAAEAREDSEFFTVQERLVAAVMDRLSDARE